VSGSVLVVAPHPDDESIGCGGTICLHRLRGEPVRVVFLTSGERGIEGLSAESACKLREDEAVEALAVLGVEGMDFLRLPDLGVSGVIEVGARRLAAILQEHRPGVIYLPHPEEAHPDHEAALPLVRAGLALRGDGQGPELRGYEVWTPLTVYDWPEDIDAVMRTKLRAIRCYRSQLRAFAYDRAMRGLNQYRGCLAARCRYAEVFRHLEAATQ
jgi:LmbE family N-acetylglucosaminyl deacetylase